MTISPALAFSPDGQILVSGSTKMRPPLHLWNVADGRLLSDLSATPWTINAAAFSPDGQTLATARQLFRVRDGQLLQTFANTADPVAFSPDGNLLVTGSCDNTIKLWNAGDGHLLRKLDAQQYDLTALALSPDGQYLAASQRTVAPDWHRLGAPDNVISLWRLRDGQLLRRISRPLTDVYRMTFSPDGRLLAVACEESVTLWRVQDGQMAHRFAEANRQVAFVAHSDLLATGCPEGGVKFWRLQDGR
jgi:WD40 repeat protein